MQDYLLASFDVEADVSSLFNWNTKQVFLSIVAEYNSISHVSRIARSISFLASAHAPSILLYALLVYPRA